MNKNREYDKIPCFSYLSGYTIYGGESFWRETGYFSNISPQTDTLLDLRYTKDIPSI
jgi:hypothetical protein